MRVIIFDFDKTLTFRDSFSQMCMWRMRGKRILFLPIYCLLKIGAKLRMISIKKEKELLFKMIFPSEYNKFDSICKEFAPKIELNNLTFLVNKEKNSGNRVIIVSASPENYIKYIFPDVEVIGTTLKLNSSAKISGIEQHPYGKEKMKCLLREGVNIIDVMYYDSKSDEELIPICYVWLRVSHGRIIAKYDK